MTKVHNKKQRQESARIRESQAPKTLEQLQAKLATLPINGNSTKEIKKLKARIAAMQSK